MFLRCLFCLFFSTVVYFNGSAGDYEDAWKALAQNDRKVARELLSKSMNDPRTAVDAYITSLFLQTFDGKDHDISDFLPALYNKVKDPNPYIYALWFNGAVLGSYGKKSGHQLQLLERLLTDPALNGSIRAAAHYFKAMHYEQGNDFTSAQKEWAKIGAVKPAWQLVGPFDNISGSGYYKNFGPLEHPEPDASFTSFNNAAIKWYTPSSMCNEGYEFLMPYFRRNTAVVYAQTFVWSPDDRQLLINVGASGSIKVWINDLPALASSREMTTELDYFRQSIHLKKGYNRLLIQLGYTDAQTPNFIARFTDDRYNPISDLIYTASYQPYPKESADPKTVSTMDAPTSIKHFAEEFFEKKITEDPKNLVNYLLLAGTYLRDDKLIDARKVITDALKSSPDNSLLRFQLMLILIKEHNRTRLLEEVEGMKKKDADCLVAIKLNLSRLIDEKKYDEAFKELDHCISLYGEDEDSWLTKMRFYSNLNKMDELIKTIQTAYEKYPDNPDIVNWMWSLKVNGFKDAKAGIGVLETYLKTNYNYSIIKILEEEYIKQGEKEKALQILQTSQNNFPYEPEIVTNISSFHYDQAAYEKAADLGRKALTLAPYVSTYWENLGLELQQQHSDSEAIRAYRQALYYDANKYSAREHLRDLEKKPSLWKAFPETDIYQAIRDVANKTFDYDYFYITDDKFAIVYPEGATEEYITICIRILTEKGLNKWKETSIAYNSSNQELKVEKAETVKRSGSVVPAEQNDGHVVYTGLEVGDAIILKYKIQHYAEGRITRHFWDSYNFNGYVPELMARYCLLIANNVKFDYKIENGTIEPEKKAYDDYTLYKWQLSNTPVLGNEPFMPPLSDIGPTLHLSTLPSWSDIANWYNDLSTSQTEEDFEVKEVFAKLFPQGVGSLSDREKASRIYRYIMENIHYSSVPFRQGAFIPQKASVTINTRLGDCKDVSSLFITLARLSGLKANLVLVNTRDNGIKAMELPSMEFNHCVVKTWLEGKPYFLELTDNGLPFASIPSNLGHAQCLVIPSEAGKAADARLEFLESPFRLKDRISRQVVVRAAGSNLSLKVDVCKTGALTSGVRSDYGGLSAAKQLEQMQNSVSTGFKNAVKVDSVAFRGLGDYSDSIRYQYACTIQNEIIEVGNMHMIKVPFGDAIASVDNFSKDDRQFPIEYWRYENADEYETKLTVEAPVGTRFIEIPKSESFSFKGSAYSLQYIPINTRQLMIIRKASLQRDNVQPEDYKAMKDFFNKIVKTESKYLVFK